MGYKLFIFSIIVPFVLYGMEQEKKQSIISSFTSKVQSFAASILSASKSPKKDKDAVLQLASLLQLKLKEITLLKAGQEIEVTDQVTKILQEHDVVYYGVDKTTKYTLPNNKNITIKTGIYMVRNDSYITKYPITEIHVYYAPTSYAPIVRFKVAHHIALRKILKVMNRSIFKPSYEIETTDYDLDIMYDNHPEKTSWAFELNEKNNVPVIFDTGFENHEERIINYTKLMNPTIQDLLILKRS